MLGHDGAYSRRFLGCVINEEPWGAQQGENLPFPLGNTLSLMFLLKSLNAWINPARAGNAARK
jgi:hypothetical protein